MPIFDPVFGKFQEGKFLGATVVDFTVNGSWNEQSYNLNITLVEDFSAGDECILQDGQPNVDGGQLVGTCLSFQYGGFRFDGLLKSFDKSLSMEGYPLYKVVLTPPNEILEAVQVILGYYIGPNSDILFGGSPQKAATFEVSNLLNVYGWAEGGGTNFGRSNLTDIGMPWNGEWGVKAGLEFLTSQADQGAVFTNFGSFINYKGNTYSLDLSNLPIPPSFYYIGGVVNMSLMDLMNRFFEDAGVFYLVKLTKNPNNSTGPHTISFITINHFVQQPLGKILSYINDQSNISSSNHGQELRSDITQTFLVGGSQNILQPVQNNGLNLSIIPFWGFDFNGNPIIGVRPDGSQTADDNLQMNLNATSITDIMGELGYGYSYPCTILELRCALGNFDTWAAYIQLYKPILAKQLNLSSVWDSLGISTAINIFDMINDGPDFVNTLSAMFDDNHWPAVAQRLYEYVRSQADVYYGKKFIVQLPFNIKIDIDPTTAKISLSNELSDAGYIPEDSAAQVLNLNYINENFFLDQTGRFYPFVRFLFYSLFNSVAGQKIISPNISYLKGSSAVIQYDTNPQYAYIFSRCEQGEDAPVYQNGVLGGGSPIFFVPNGVFSVPAMVVTIPDAIWAQADDITGSITDLSSMLNIDLNTLQDAVNERSTSFNMIIHPPAYYPDAIAVALKSNQELYGPWGKFSAHGKLNFEQDDGLVPWEYGGYTALNQAAVAKLNTIAMGNQVLERGDIIEAGLPKISLGEQLVEEGPILSSIVCNINVSQVTTTYTMETFVNRVGAFTFENAERLKRIGKYYQQLRRTIRQSILTALQRSNIMAENYLGFMYGTSYAVEQRTPHAVLGSRLIRNKDGNYIPTSWTQTYQESLANLGLRNIDTFQSTACVGMEALLRPYSNDINSDFLPFLVRPNENYQVERLITSTGLNPIVSGCDINWLLSGKTYTSLRTSKGLTDYNTARSLALRGPVMICGYGYDIGGNPIPNSGQIVNMDSGTAILDFTTPLQDCNSSYIPNYLQQSFNWPVGPLDLMYDQIRGCWASPGMILHGKTAGDINPGSTGLVTLQIATENSQEQIKVHNFFTQSSATIKNNSQVQIGWNPLEKYWEIISAACPDS